MRKRRSSGRSWVILPARPHAGLVRTRAALTHPLARHMDTKGECCVIRLLKTPQHGFSRNCVVSQSRRSMSQCLRSVNPCKTWATHSHPALVILVRCGGPLNNLSHLLRHGRATRRLMASPATIPLTPPSGQAVSRPERTMSTTIWGTLACARRSTTLETTADSFPHAKEDGDVQLSFCPPAAPLREDRKLRQSLSVSNLNGPHWNMMQKFWRNWVTGHWRSAVRISQHVQRVSVTLLQGLACR